MRSGSFIPFVGLHAFGKLPTFRSLTCAIVDEKRSLEVREQADAAIVSSDGAKPAIRAFVISLQGEIDVIEPIRLPLAEFIHEQKFEHRYILVVFGGKLIDNSAFLIDFDELGELVFEQTSGFLTREDIETRVTQLPETIEALKALKADLQSNYHKFFKSAFADRDFKAKWNKWEHLRNKIAHTNLFTSEDLADGKKLAGELFQIITAAEESKDQPVVTQSEREAMQEQVIARTDMNEILPPPQPEPIPCSLSPGLTEEAFLCALEQQESYYRNKPNGFVGLRRFIRFYLPELGFDEDSAGSMLNRLQRENKIEVYYVPNPYDGASRTAALRSAI